MYQGKDMSDQDPRFAGRTFIDSAPATKAHIARMQHYMEELIEMLMRRALEEAHSKAAASEHQKAVKLFRRYYAEHLLDQTALYPPVMKVLEFFKDREQAVLTNKPENFSVRILKELGVSEFFSRVIGGDTGLPKKPDPAAALEILREAEVKPEEAVYIGDSALDIETGRNAGMKAIAVTYGFGKRAELEKSNPDYLLEDLGALIECPLFKN